ncbi:MAG: hypothetical protein LBF74_06100 [Treponema sp.]|jgi:hypothetical protein|nr:hypothetical protein [Treponema sp.]
MKCAACGYEGSYEEDFGVELFLSTMVFLNRIDDAIDRIIKKPVCVYVCPKCMTLKLMTPEDKENEKNFEKQKPLEAVDVFSRHWRGE